MITFILSHFFHVRTRVRSSDAHYSFSQLASCHLTPNMR